MSTTYNTSAKPRTRRQTQVSEPRSTNPTSIETASEPSKRMARKSEETFKRIRPGSPALHVQRNRTLEAKPSLTEPLSPRSSVNSIKPKLVPLSQRDSQSEILPSRSVLQPQPLTADFPPPEPKHSHGAPHVTHGSRPTSPASQPLTSLLRSNTVSHSQAEPMPEADADADATAIPWTGTTVSSSMATLQPRAEDVHNDSAAIFTPTLSVPVHNAGIAPEAASSFLRGVYRNTDADVEFPAGKMGTGDHASSHRQYSRSATPVMSPPQSPGLGHYTSIPATGQMPYYQPSNMMSSGPHIYHHHPFYGQPFSAPPDYSAMGSDAQSLRSVYQGENSSLFEKISGVLPDIHRLLDQYRETHGQLSAKDDHVKRAETLHTEQLDKLRVELDATRAEYEKVIRDIVSENSRLKREAEEAESRSGAMEIIVNEHAATRDKLDRFRASHQEINEEFEALRILKDQLEVVNLTQSQEIRRLEALLEEHRALLSADEANHCGALAEKQKEHDAAIGEHKLILSKVQLELANLITRHSTQRKELEAVQIRAADHKVQLESKIKELEDTVTSHQQELKALHARNDEDRRAIVKEYGERSAKLVEQYSVKEKEIVHSLDALRVETQARSEGMAWMRAENGKYKQKHADLAVGFSTWTSKYLDLQKEHENMEMLLRSSGIAVEPTSKEDTTLQG